MAWSTPRTWVAGETVTAALMNTHVRDNFDAIGGAWTSYAGSIVLAQGASTNIAKTVNYAKYLSIGKLVICQIKLSATAAGTAGSPITASLPVTAAGGASFLAVGSGFFTDASVGEYRCVAYLNSSTVVALARGDSSLAGGIGVNPNIAVASGDVFVASIMYEAA